MTPSPKAIGLTLTRRRRLRLRRTLARTTPADRLGHRGRPGRQAEQD
jgi:hypothetical protein